MPFGACVAAKRNASDFIAENLIENHVICVIKATAKFLQIANETKPEQKTYISKPISWVQMVLASAVAANRSKRLRNRHEKTIIFQTNSLPPCGKSVRKYSNLMYDDDYRSFTQPHVLLQPDRKWFILVSLPELRNFADTCDQPKLGFYWFASTKSVFHSKVIYHRNPAALHRMSLCGDPNPPQPRNFG